LADFIDKTETFFHALLDEIKSTGNPFRLEVAIEWKTMDFVGDNSFKELGLRMNGRVMDNIKYLVSNLALVPVESDVVVPLRYLCDALLQRLRIGQEFLIRSIGGTCQQLHYQLCSEFMAIYTDCLAKFKVFNSHCNSPTP
jgi:hypothetical protein